MSLRTISREALTLGRELARGEFGVVLEGTHDGGDVVVKKVANATRVVSGVRPTALPA